MMRTTESYFRDWENNTFGFGYGSGEPHTIPAIKKFMSLCSEGSAAHQYDFRELEKELTPIVAWLLINTLCHVDMIEYGTSPRFGWLTKKGERLKEFVSKHTANELIDIACDHDENYHGCSPDYCNCGENGYEKGRVCLNPFWTEKS